ncbi:MAG: ABC transporter ATP-binding protein [Armatimonadetes bacterium]|nr:ABC transporter ATP-binding protein [Armatimonadota bacterium]
MIELQGVEKTYRTGEVLVTVLRGINLVVEEGEYVSIMGPSGSGKSTLMNTLGCLDKPTAGTYLLDGKDVSRLDDDELAAVRNRKLGFVFQSYNLLPRTPAIANVELPLLYSRNGRNRHERARAALERVGLGDRIYHLPSQLSGGEQQRVGIARALINEPRILLADEPTGNLDSRTGAGILELLHELNEQGMTIVMVTHDDNVAHCTKRIVHILDGVVERDELTDTGKCAVTADPNEEPS